MTYRIASLFLAIVAFVSFSNLSQAAFITHTTQASYNTAVSGLGAGVTRFANFDATATGNKTVSFSDGGLTFTGATEVSPGNFSPINLGVSAGTTASPNNFLGVFDPVVPDFQGGDRLTITVPVNQRAFGLNIVSDTVPDGVNNYVRLTVGATSVDILAGTGTPLPGGGNFQSYFIGITGALAGDVTNTATVSFVGTLYRVDNVTSFAVPEPTSMALVGIVGIASLIRRRVRKA